MRSLFRHSNTIQKILLVFIFQSFCLIGWSQSKDNSTGQSLDFYKGRVFDVSFSDESIRLPFTLGKSEAFSEWFIIDRTAGEYKLGTIGTSFATVLLIRKVESEDFLDENWPGDKFISNKKFTLNQYPAIFDFEFFNDDKMYGVQIYVHPLKRNKHYYVVTLGGTSVDGSKMIDTQTLESSYTSVLIDLIYTINRLGEN